MKINTSKRNIVSSPLLSVDFSFTSGLERRLNGFLDVSGEFQKHIDGTFMTKLWDYMPFAQDGSLKESTIVNTVIGSGLITTATPYAHYLYRGYLWVDPVTKKGAFFDPNFGFWSRPGVPKEETTRLLQYNGAPKRGPRWDQRMWSEQGDTLLADWQRYVKQNF